MPSEEPVNLALSDAAARQLADATKTTAQPDIITPRWLLSSVSTVVDIRTRVSDLYSSPYGTSPR